MQSDIEKPALGVFGKSWLKAMSSKKPHLCIPNQRIHKCGFCAKSTLINSENSHSGRAGVKRVSRELPQFVQTAQKRVPMA